MKTTPLLTNYQTSITCLETILNTQKNNSDILIKTPHFGSITLTFRTKLRTPGTQLRASEHNSEPPGTQLRLPEHNSELLECNSGISPKNSVHNSEPSIQLRLFDGTYSDHHNPIMNFPWTSQSVYNYVILLDSSCSVEVGIPLAHPLQSVD